MEKKKVYIDGIPAVLWGTETEDWIVAVHGNMSHKEDEVIRLLADEAVKVGYQVLSFDLPEHGERDGKIKCDALNCVSEIGHVWNYARQFSGHLSLFACSMGAYFALLALEEQSIERCWFLSPVVDMLRVIENMMTWFSVSESRLQQEKQIETPIGQTLYWDYYSYVKAHPVLHWSTPTHVLYGEKDELSEYAFVSRFSQHFNCTLEVMEDGEHYFHTLGQLRYFKQWLQKSL